jgi:hypothetical protein
LTLAARQPAHATATGNGWTRPNEVPASFKQAIARAAGSTTTSTTPGMNAFRPRRLQARPNLTAITSLR